MKRVLMVGPVPPPRGGIASTMQEIVSSTLSEDYAFDVFSRPFRFPDGVTGTIGRSLIRAKKYLRFWRKCIVGRYDLMHIHTPGHRFLSSSVYMLLARLSCIKVLLHLHGNDWNVFYVDATPRMKFVLRRGLSLANRIVVLQKVWAEEIDRLGIGAHASVLPNMIPAAKPYDADVLNAVRKEFDLQEQDFVLLMVGAGAVGKPKGIYDLLDAIPIIAAEEDAVRLVVAGGEEEPGETADVLEVIEKKKLGKWTRILGDIEREQVNMLMEIASVYVLPSYVEGMPISIMEAMRSRTAVVATPVGAVPEMIEHEKTGLLIDPGAPEQIVDVVLRLRNEQGLSERLIADAESAFHRKFELEQGVRQLRSIYEELQ